MSPSLNDAAHPLDAMPSPAPAPAPKGGHAGLWAFLMLIVGLALGGGAVWYLNPAAPAAPQESLSPSPAAVALPSVVSLPPASGLTFNPLGGRCAPASPCDYEVWLDQKKVGMTQVPQGGPYPGTVRRGSGWAVFQTPPDGLGGYILYSRYFNLSYVNVAGVTPLASGFADAGFSPDFSHIAVLTGSRGAKEFAVQFFDLATGKADQVATAIPATAEDAQAGLPTYSPDGTMLAVAVGYGPDNEHGEIYVTYLRDASSWKKVADTPRPPAELWWTADGSIAWR